jgi:hypothetical protein
MSARDPEKCASLNISEQKFILGREKIGGWQG